MLIEPNDCLRSFRRVKIGRGYEIERYSPSPRIQNEPNEILVNSRYLGFHRVQLITVITRIKTTSNLY